MSESTAAQAAPATHRQVLTVDGKTVHLLGTAHISSQSEEEVGRMIAEVRPDTVAVELCEPRYHSLTRPDTWREMDLLQVVRNKRATLLLMQLVLAAFQKRLGEHVGIKPGAEMLRAIEAAEAQGAELVLADRNIQVTLLRTWRGLRWWEKFKLVFQMLVSLVASAEVSAEDIEALKQEDMLGQVMAAFADAFPRAKATLIDERDTYLAHKIRNAPGRTIVAVVGAGHLQGILAHLRREAGDASLAELEYVPPASPVAKGVQWLVPLIVLGLIGYGFVAADAGVSWRMVQIWVLANGLLSALGALLALAHPLTIAVAFVAAPLTSLNPMIAAGWVAGLCEAAIRKPRVRDFEALPQDIATLGGFWRNGITRILLVVALANVGSSLGTFIGIPWMTSLLGQ
jgi:pheromone shutdown-related protein TraB